MHPGERPTPPGETWVDRLAHTPMSRREQLMILGLATVAMIEGTAVVETVKLLDEHLTNEIYPHRDTQLVVVTGSEAPSSPEIPAEEVKWVAYQGWGVQDGVGQAHALVEKLGVPSAAGLVFPPQGILMDQNRALVKEYIGDDKRVKMLGQSLGFLMGLIIHAGMDKPPHFDEIVALGSPTSVDDVPPRLRTGAEFVVENNLTGDALQKLVVRVAADFGVVIKDPKELLTNPSEILKRVASQAYKETVEGTSAMVFAAGLYILCLANLEGTIATLVHKGAITKGTVFTYCKSDPSSLDTTVYDDLAIVHLSEVLQQYGIGLNVVPYVGGHANTPLALDAYRPSYQRNLAAQQGRE